MKTKNNSLNKNIEGSKIKNFIEEHNLNIEDIFNRMNLGIGIFNGENNKIVFMNRYLKSVVSRNGENFVKELWKHINNRSTGNLNIPGMIETDEEFSEKYGFSNYRISDDSEIVLLNEITYKSIATKSQMDNFLYDKMSEMIAEISHEIGNPLAGICTMLELMLSRFDDFSREKSRNYLERTIDEINRLTKILRKIRSVYIDNKMELETADLHVLVSKIYNLNKGEFDNKKVIFNNNIKEKCFGIIDEDAFLQIIKNFFDNSLSVLKPGQWIKISAETIGDEYIRMVYRNNGETIPEESFEKIFLPLYSTKIEGSGLGLFISLKLMTRMGGTIKIVKPENKKGVKFIFYIPKKKNGYGKKEE